MGKRGVVSEKAKEGGQKRTDYHAGELEALADGFPVDLVGEVGEPDVAHELLADDARETGVVAVGGSSAIGTSGLMAVLVAVVAVRLRGRGGGDVSCTGHGCEYFFCVERGTFFFHSAVTRLKR